jgi:hypothetical protein
MSVFDYPIVEKFEHDRYCGIIRQYRPDFPDATTRYYPTYRKSRGGRQRGWHGDGYATVEECREFLEQQIDKAAAEEAENRKRGVEKRKRRREERIAKIARDYLRGTGTGSRLTCAICDKALSDPVSVERGIGSECWPRLLDALTREVPRCEENIARLRDAIAEREKQNFTYWQTEYARLGFTDPRLIADLADRKLDAVYDDIRSMKGRIADAEALLAAVRKWAGDGNQSARPVVGEG